MSLDYRNFVAEIHGVHAWMFVRRALRHGQLRKPLAERTEYFLPTGGRGHPLCHLRLGVTLYICEVPLEKLFEKWKRHASGQEQGGVQESIGRRPVCW